MPVHQQKSSFHHKLLMIIIRFLETKSHQRDNQSHQWVWQQKKSAQRRAKMQLCLHQLRMNLYGEKSKIGEKPGYGGLEYTETNHSHFEKLTEHT